MPGCDPLSATLSCFALNRPLVWAPDADTIGNRRPVSVRRFTVVSSADGLVAVMVQVVFVSTLIESGAQVLVRFTSPCCGTNATGRCRAGRPDRVGVSRTSPNCCSAVGLSDLMVMPIVAVLPAATVNCEGDTVMELPAGALALTR